MNNAVFGKTMEDVKSRMNLHLTTNHDNAVKWFSKPNLKGCKMVNGIYMIEMFKNKVKLDKPIYIGTSILDLSKVCMMDFHYNVIEKYFPNKNWLLYTDTDGLKYLLEHEDIYKWVDDNRDHFDLSECKRKGLHDVTNKKVLGKMKDESYGLLNKEFVTLNPKVYSGITQKLDDDKNEIYDYNKKALKGVSKSVVENEIKHEDYKRVLFSSSSIKKDTLSIRSLGHEVHTIKQSKKALSCFYDKMRLLNEIECQPYGFESN